MKFRGIALAVVGVVAASVMMMNVGPTSGSNFLEASDSEFYSRSAIIDIRSNAIEGDIIESCLYSGC